MSGVVHVVASAFASAGANAGARASARALLLASALHDPGRPHIVVSGDADDDTARSLSTRLRVVAGLKRDSGFAPLQLAGDAACLVDLTRILDVLVDRVRSPMIVQTHGEHARAGVLGRLAARALRGVVNVHVDDAPVPDTLGADVFISTSGLHGAARTSSRVIADGFDAAPFYALIDIGDSERRRRRESLGVAQGASLVVTDARAGDARLTTTWRARYPRADVVPLVPLSESDHDREQLLVLLGAADAALLAAPSLHEALAAVASGLAVVIVGARRDVVDALAWAKRVTFLDAGASAQDVDAALSRIFAAKPLAPSTRARHAKLPRELTRAGMLASWSELYDELIGPARPTGDAARRRPMPRRRAHALRS